MRLNYGQRHGRENCSQAYEQPILTGNVLKVIFKLAKSMTRPSLTLKQPPLPIQFRR